MTVDAFGLLAHALRARWVANGAAWPAESASESDRTRNLLLDASGSDHRALVELVLTVGDDVRRSLVVPPEHDAAHGQASSVAWEVQRAPLVHRLVATRFLQTDIARWLIDCWAYAVGVRDVLPASPSLESVAPERPVSGVHTTAARGATPWRRAGGATTAAPPSAMRTGTAGLGVAAAAYSSAASGQRRGGFTAGGSRLSPAQQAHIQRMERTGLTLLAGTVVFAMFAYAYAMWSKPLEREFLAQRERQARRSPPGDAASASTIDASSTSRPAASITSVAAPNATVNAPRVPIADANHDVVASPTTSGLDDAVARPASAGRYRVSHRATSVTGGEGCDQVAGALARGQSTVEEVAQQPGTSTLHLVTRGLTGSVQPDGQFVFGPDSGTTDGVRWTFVMRGRFTSSGFVAQSEKTTTAIMKWHSLRACAVVADLTGTRLPS